VAGRHIYIVVTSTHDTDGLSLACGVAERRRQLAVMSDWRLCLADARPGVLWTKSNNRTRWHISLGLGYLPRRQLPRLTWTLFFKKKLHLLTLLTLWMRLVDHSYTQSQAMAQTEPHLYPSPPYANFLLRHQSYRHQYADSPTTLDGLHSAAFLSVGPFITRRRHSLAVFHHSI